jgi:hypothetical protein
MEKSAFEDALETIVTRALEAESRLGAAPVMPARRSRSSDSTTAPMVRLLRHSAPWPQRPPRLQRLGQQHERTIRMLLRQRLPLHEQPCVVEERVAPCRKLQSTSTKFAPSVSY